jgi:peptidoglycan/xylan/chitin deacetylase (PgdA/CDA1 family)
MKILPLALGALSPSGTRARLSVLIFHRVLREPDLLFPQEVDATRFGEICGWVRDWFNVLPLNEAVQRLQEGTLPPRAMGISFDDGYADNRQVAVPILRKNGLPATFFVATDYLDGGRMWNDTVIESVRGMTANFLKVDHAALPQAPMPTATVAERRKAIEVLIRCVKYLEPPERLAAVEAISKASGVTAPTDLMMSSDEVRQLRTQGMLVGAHTASHPILARVSESAARQDIARGKSRLEEILDEPVTLFAYPNGKPGEDYVSQNVGHVREAGFAAAFSTAWGAARHSTSPFELPRFTPWDVSRLAFSMRLLHNLATR